MKSILSIRLEIHAKHALMHIFMSLGLGVNGTPCNTAKKFLLNISPITVFIYAGVYSR
jgi:hypothetical protein